MKNEGFTVIEVIILILVVGIALTPLISVFGNVLHSSAEHHSIRTATFLAQGLMEEVTGRDFEDIGSFTLPEGALSSRHASFSASVEVWFVTMNDFNTQVEDLTDFKRIRVSVDWRDNSAELITIAARR